MISLTSLICLVTLGSSHPIGVFHDSNFEKAVYQYLEMKSLGDANISEIESLEVWGEHNISSLVGIEKLKRLKHLQIIEKGLKDISPLAELGGLAYLRLDGNKIEDVNALAALSKLQELRLDYNQIKNLQPLTQLKNLRILSVVGNPLSEQSYVTDIPVIKTNNPGIRLYTDRSFTPAKALVWAKRVVFGVFILILSVQSLLIHIFVRKKLVAHMIAPLAALCTFILTDYFILKAPYVISALPMMVLLSVVISLVIGFSVLLYHKRIQKRNLPMMPLAGELKS